MSETISPDTTIAQYRVISKIGEGGMGEVYRARDTKLGRDVATKVLPSAFSEDSERSGSAFEPGIPKALFDLSAVRMTVGGYAVTADGQRFLFVS
jgi:serine/threonine protein kinase